MKQLLCPGAPGVSELSESDISGWWTENRTRTFSSPNFFASAEYTGMGKGWVASEAGGEGWPNHLPLAMPASLQDRRRRWSSSVMMDVCESQSGNLRHDMCRYSHSAVPVSSDLSQALQFKYHKRVLAAILSPTLINPSPCGHPFVPTHAFIGAAGSTRRNFISVLYGTALSMTPVSGETLGNYTEENQPPDLHVCQQA
jgi:hypothetical protein